MSARTQASHPKLLTEMEVKTVFASAGPVSPRGYAAGIELHERRRWQQL